MPGWQQIKLLKRQKEAMTEGFEIRGRLKATGEATAAYLFERAIDIIIGVEQLTQQKEEHTNQVVIYWLALFLG